MIRFFHLLYLCCNLCIFFPVNLHSFFSTLHRQHNQKKSQQNLQNDTWKRDVDISSCHSAYKGQRHHHVCHSVIYRCTIRLLRMSLPEVEEKPGKSRDHYRERTDCGGFLKSKSKESLDHRDSYSSSPDTRDIS